MESKEENAKDEREGENLRTRSSVKSMLVFRVRITLLSHYSAWNDNTYTSVLHTSDLCCVDPVIVLRSRHKAHVCGINSTESILLPSSALITPWKTAAGAIETCIILRIQCM